jgi:hypothetical protein
MEHLEVSMKSIDYIQKIFVPGYELPYRLDAMHVNEDGTTEYAYRVASITEEVAIKHMIRHTDLTVEQIRELLC